MIKKLTKKQKEAMPAYRDMWIAKGLRTGKTDWETFDKYMPVCYKKANLAYPSRIVRVASPLIGALAASVAEGIWQKTRKNSYGAVGNTVGNAVDDAVGGAVAGAVGSAVDNVVSDAVRGAVSDAVGNAVRGTVSDTVGGAVAGAVSSAVSDAVRGAVSDAVDSVVSDAVRGTVSDAVGDAIGNTVDSAVSDAVRDAIGNTVDSAVSDAVRGAVSDAVNDAVDDAIGGAVRDAVHGAVSNTVRGTVSDTVGDTIRNTVDGTVRDAVQTTISIAKKSKITISRHYWLGGQFLVGGWYWGVSFVNFFFDVCKLKLSKDIMERTTAYRKVCESVNYIWPNKDFVIVCARPTKILRNAQGRLHNIKGKAIEYPDGWGIYAINGVRFDEKLFKTIISENVTAKDILSIKDIDQRTQAMRFLSPEEMVKELKGKLLDEYNKFDIETNPVNYKLYKFPKGEIFSEDAYYCLFDCPSTRKRHMEGVEVSKTVPQAMSWAEEISEEEWKLRIPLLDEV